MKLHRQTSTQRDHVVAANGSHGTQVEAGTMTTDLQAQRSIAEGSFGSAEQRNRTRQIDTRPVEILQIVQREEGGGRLGGVVDVVVLQQLQT